MTVIGRNEPCYCGSGKKYKKCCLKFDEEKLSKGEIPRPSGDSFEIAYTTHDLSFGIKQMALAQLEQIGIWLSKKHIKPSSIQVNSTDLYELATTDDMIEHYLRIIREVLMVKGTPNIHLELMNLRERAKTFPSLTENERTIIRSISKSNLGEFLMLSDANTADYSAMKVLNEFCYQAIKEGISHNKYVSAVTLYVDSNGTDKERLVNWELSYSDSVEPTKDIWVEWKPLDVLNDEYRKFAHSLHGLEEHSKNDLATALYQEKSLPVKSKERISYRGLVMTYTGILEKELKLLVELNAGRYMADLMMKKINEYIRDNHIPYLTENIPDVYEQLEVIREIRNNAAHGNEIGYDDFQKVKQFVFDQQVLEFLSWAKIDYEDNEKVPFQVNNLK